VFGVQRRYVFVEYDYFRSIENLTEEVTTIIQVIVLEERTELINVWAGVADRPAERDPYDVFTIYTIQVIEVFKGNVVSGDIIEVRRRGGEFGDRILVNESAVPLTIGEELVLFLIESVVEPSGRTFVSLVPAQSIYRLDENGEPISHPRNNFILTREMLTQIRYDESRNAQDPQHTVSNENNDNNIYDNDTRDSNFIWILIIIIAVLVVGIFIILLICRKNKRLKESN